MHVEWDEDLNIGIERVDRQHKEIFKQTNRFLDTLKSIKEDDQERLKNEVKELFYFLTDYVITHFESEELLQRENNYPNYESHKKVHEDFIAKINQLKYNFFNEDKKIDKLVAEIKEEVLGWLANHIGKEDRRIKEYIK